MGCTAPHDAPIQLKCSNDGILTTWDEDMIGTTDNSTYEGFTCIKQNNSTQTCRLTSRKPEKTRNLRVTRRLQTFDDDLYDDIMMAELQIAQRAIIAICEGTTANQSLSLSARVSFEEEMASQQGLPDKERMGYCTHIWEERPSNEGGGNNATSTTTVDWSYGGGGSGFVSVTLLCPVDRQPSQKIELGGTTCAAGGGLLVGQFSDVPGNETVPFCTFFSQCSETAYGCPIDDTSQESNPCLSTASCSFTFRQVETAPPSTYNVGSCSVLPRQEEDIFTPQAIESAMQPYILTKEDFGVSLTSVRNQVLSTAW